jgi:hypothetical protein
MCWSSLGDLEAIAPSFELENDKITFELYEKDNFAK